MQKLSLLTTNLKKDPDAIVPEASNEKEEILEV